MEFIQSPELPAPAGHYSQAVVTRGGLVFVSGVLPARDLPDASFEAQCASVFDQCEKILRAAGCDRMQGYLFARPMPGDQCEALLRDQAAGAGAETDRIMAAAATLRANAY